MSSDDLRRQELYFDRVSPRRSYLGTTKICVYELAASWLREFYLPAVFYLVLPAHFKSQNVIQDFSSENINSNVVKRSSIPNAVVRSMDIPSENPKWIEPTSLIKQLEILERNSLTSNWAQSTWQVIDELVNNNGIGDPASKESFSQLKRQIESADRLIIQSNGTGALAIHLTRARYSIQRRLDVWRAVHDLAGIEYRHTTGVSADESGNILAASRSRLSFDDIEAGWASYLDLEEAEKVFNSITANNTRQQRTRQKSAARKVLARLHSPALTINQQAHLNRIIVFRSEQFPAKYRSRAGSTGTFSKTC